MWQLGLICALFSGANAAIAGASAGAASGSSGSGLYSSNYIGNGYGSSYPYVGGYTSGYTGTGFVPFFPVVPPYVGFGFNNDLQRYIQHQFNAIQSNIASLYEHNLAQQAAIMNTIRNYAEQPGYYSTYAPNFSAAAASGSIGPGGVYQSASIYPSNVRSPNVNTRFGPGESVVVSSGGPGYQGVSSYVSSSSHDVNGVRGGHREAVTSVNDNGRVTTYRVRS